MFFGKEDIHIYIYIIDCEIDRTYIKIHVQNIIHSRPIYDGKLDIMGNISLFPGKTPVFDVHIHIYRICICIYIICMCICMYFFFQWILYIGNGL